MAEASSIFVAMAKLISWSSNEGHECPASPRRQKIRELAKYSRNCCGNWPRWTRRNLWTDVSLLETAQTGPLQRVKTEPGDGCDDRRVHILILWRNFHQRRSRAGGSERLGTGSLSLHLLSTGQTGSKQVPRSHQLPVAVDRRGVPELFDMVLHPLSKPKAGVWETSKGDATAGPMTSFRTNWKSYERTAETRKEKWENNPTFRPVGLRTGALMHWTWPQQPQTHCFHIQTMFKQQPMILVSLVSQTLSEHTKSQLCRLKRDTHIGGRALASGMLTIS